MKDNSINKANQNNITYSILTFEDIDQTADLAAKAFTTNEAIITHLKVSHKNMFTFVKNHLLTERMERSIIAKDGNKVVGLFLNELGSDSEVQYKHLGPQFLLIADLLEMMSKNYLKQYPYKSQQIFNMLIAACQKQYNNRGILYRLILQSLQHAKLLGCKVALSELTGPKIQHVFVNKLGFKVQKQYRYNDMSGTLSPLNGCERSEKIIMVHKNLQQN